MPWRSVRRKGKLGFPERPTVMSLHREIASEEGEPEIELTHNWDEPHYSSGNAFGHLAFRVDDIHATCQRLADGGIAILRPPRDGYMAFVKDPSGVSIELLQTGQALTPQEPWASMPSTGSW